MKIILMVTILLIGCDDGHTYTYKRDDGYSVRGTYICIDGWRYIQIDRGIAPAFSDTGQLIYCGAK